MISSISSSSWYDAAYAAQKSAQTEESGKAQAGFELGAAALAAQYRDQANLQILQASSSVSITAGEQPQALLFSAAIDRINELLAPELGANALQNLAATQDNSPEATAERIVSLSTAFYDLYAQQHPGEDPETLANNFIDLIRGGFEKGFNEAKGILESLQVFNGDIAAGVMKTYDLVTQGYDKFLADKVAALKGEGA
jgi:hypothetical protein